MAQTWLLKYADVFFLILPFTYFFLFLSFFLRATRTAKRDGAAEPAGFTPFFLLFFRKV